MRHHVIIPPQATLWKDGGFTLALNLQSPPKRYLVSLEGFEKVFPPRLFQQGPSDAEILRYVRENWAQLREENRYFGGWRDGETCYLDVSTSFDSLDSALAFGAQGNQKAIFDSVEGRVIVLA